MKYLKTNNEIIKWNHQTNKWNSYEIRLVIEWNLQWNCLTNLWNCIEIPWQTYEITLKLSDKLMKLHWNCLTNLWNHIMKWCLQRMKPFIIECGIIHIRLQALVDLLSLKWLPPVVVQPSNPCCQKPPPASPFAVDVISACPSTLPASTYQRVN